MTGTGLRIAIAGACLALFAGVALVASNSQVADPVAAPTTPEIAEPNRPPRLSGEASATPAPDPKAAEANAIPRPHALNGSVHEEGGRALPGAVVRADPAAVFPNVPEHRVAVETTADASGAFDLCGLSAGNWTLSVSADGAVGAFAALVRVPDVARYDLVVPRGAAVTGSLVDETTRAPVIGARVRLVARNDAVLGDAATDPAGRFEMLTHRELTFVDRFEVHAAGYVHAPVTESADGPLDDLRTGRHVDVALVARPGATLSGTVIGPDGPVAGARVVLRQSFHYFHAAPPPRETRSGPAGLYRFEHVDADEYIVHAEAAGLVQAGGESPEFADAKRWTTLDVPDTALAKVPESGETSLDVRMSRVQPFAHCTIEGRVEDEDQHPIPGVTVTTLAGPLSVRATTGDDGKFVLADVATVGQPVVVSMVGINGGEEGTMVEAPAGGRTTDVVLVGYVPPKPPHARGRVLAAGAGVAGARVVIVTSSEGQMHCFAVGPFVQAAEGRSADDGTFDVPFGREGDDAWVVVEAAGFGTGFVALSEADLIEKPVDVVLSPLAPLEGRVVRAGTDEGVAGASFALDPLGDSSRSRTTEPVVAITAADGSFHVGAIPAGTVWVHVAAPGWLDLNEGFEAPWEGRIEFELSPAFRIAGRVRYAEGRPAVGLEVTAFAEDDVDPESSGAGRPAVTGADGSFACEGLTPGRFVLRVDGGVPRIVPRRVGPFDAGVRDAVVDVVPGLVLRGTVLDVEGEPVTEAVVSITLPGTTEPAGRASSDSSGGFRIDGLPAGALVLDVMSNDCVKASRREVRAGPVPIEVRVDRGLAIAGVIHDADGSPKMFGNLTAEPVDAEAPAEPRVIKADAAGEFRVTGLTRGRWKIVSGYNTKLADEPVVDAGAEHLELRIAAPPPGDDAK